MKTLIIGGSGLISRGIVKHLHARGAEITFFNRGKREEHAPKDIEVIHGDRNAFDPFESSFRERKFDVVIDMVCFNPQQAASAIRAFRGRCEQYIFCSTVCTYGVKIPPIVLIDETFPQEPISQYGRDKVACEQLLLAEHELKRLNVTIIRPSHTYGPDSKLICNLEFDSVAWDRIDKGLPVLCAGDGLGLWVSTHRDDCGKLFAYAAKNPKTYGQSYNATQDHNFTWRDYYRDAAGALGKPAKLLFMPANWIVAHDPKRFGLLKEITAFHGAYSSAKAKRDIPEFRCEIAFAQGAKEALDAIRERGELRASDAAYQSIVDRAIQAGAEPIEL